MPRIARAVAAGYPHHVTQRGNYGQPVFDEDIDRQQYLRWLKQYKDRYGLSIWAWCLMENHIHLVCVPEHTDSLARTLQLAHMRYSNYLNRKRNAHGHLWQGRFYSCVLGSEHLASAIRYVEMNPVRAGIVERAEEYAWSSARARVSGAADGVLDDGLPVKDILGQIAGGWSYWLRLGRDKNIVDVLRTNTRTGRPLGNAAFTLKMEQILGRRVKAVHRGRPKREPE